MPYEPLKPCRAAGCLDFRAAKGLYCEKHAKEYGTLDAQRRGTSSERGYGSARWLKVRLMILRRYPVCDTKDCGRASTDVDHIKPVTGPDDPLFFAEENLHGLCHGCHSHKTATRDGGFGRLRETKPSSSSTTGEGGENPSQ